MTGELSSAAPALQQQRLPDAPAPERHVTWRHAEHGRTRERSSMTCCCSSTCSRRNSISCSSLVRLRSFKDVCRFRDACADSFSFCSQNGRGPRVAAQPWDPPCASVHRGWALGYRKGGRVEGWQPAPWSPGGSGERLLGEAQPQCCRRKQGRGGAGQAAPGTPHWPRPAGVQGEGVHL